MGEDERYMRECLRLADVAGANGDVPVGAIVVLDGVIVGVVATDGRQTPIPPATPRFSR